MTVIFFLTHPRPPRSTLFPYTTLFRSSNFPKVTSLQLPEVFEARLAPMFMCCGHWSYTLSFGISGPTLSVSWTERSEEHTSELQSHSDLVCRLLLEKKKNEIKTQQNHV